MRRIYGEEVKKIQKAILENVADFCEKNEISYWIDCGTLLGAIRHKGYIPWDDDIDIGMLRPDFERFMLTFNFENERYRAECIDTNPNFHYVHGKVLDTETTLFEPDKNGNKLSINIDIFVYDNAKDKEDAEKRYNFRDKCRLFHVFRNNKHKPNRNAIMRYAIYTFRTMLKVFPSNFFIKKMSKNAKRYNNIETEYVGNFTSYARIICEKNVFSSFITAEFEGRQYKIPGGYDRWLKCFYGDYMKLPPEDKRVSHHTYEAYVEE